MSTKKDEKKFWSMVDSSGGINSCWNWKGSKNPKGYGYKGWGDRIHLSHRVAWMIKFGDIPNGMCVLHKCDNPSCCNPSHLFLGTNQDNVDDKMKKGRIPDFHGEKNPHCKLSNKQVSDIRKRYAFRGIGGEKTSDLAKEFGVSQEHIRRIVRKEYRQ